MTSERFYRSLLWLSILFIAAAIAFLSFVGCASSGMTRSLQSGVVVAQAADLVSTQAAIRSGHGHEGNPLLSSVWWQQAAIKAPVTLGLLWATAQIEERGHPVLSRLILGAVSGSIGVIAWRNYRIARAAR